MDDDCLIENFIIKNKTEMSACNAVRYVWLIVSDGMKTMPSGVEQYAHFTRIDEYIITSKKLKNETYSFTITDSK